MYGLDYIYTPPTLVSSFWLPAHLLDYHFHTIKALQPEFANNCGFPPLIQDLFDLLTGLTTSRNVLNELQLLQRCVLTFIFFGYSHRAIGVQMQDSNLLIYLYPNMGRSVLFTHAHFLKTCFRLPHTLVGVLLLFTSSCRDFS